MAHIFKLAAASLKREFAVYVVIAHGSEDLRLYVGKTGDNREGCNPLISRCGNHFSYNKIHSQVRNKLADHENREYTYVFDHFGRYVEQKTERRRLVNQVNEMERWLNQEIKKLADCYEHCELINEYKGIGHVPKNVKRQRKSFRTPRNGKKIDGIVRAVELEIRRFSAS